MSKCGLTNDTWVSLGGCGDSLTIETAGDESAGTDYDAVGCVLGRINTPDSVISQMNSTRALDGMQSASWDSITATWNYHPNSGIRLILAFDPDES